MKFLCDQMFGTLAKWLRIYGFDTLYATNELNDLDIIDITKKENRFLLTKRENIKTIEIKTTDINEQIGIVLMNFKVDKNKILSRCILCNTEVEDIKKEEIAGKVPDRIFESNEKFWFCKKCNKIYWKGSHYEKMFEKINDLS